MQGLKSSKKEEKDVSDQLEDVRKIFIVQLSEAIDAVNEGE